MSCSWQGDVELEDGSVRGERVRLAEAKLDETRRRHVRQVVEMIRAGKPRG